MWRAAVLLCFILQGATVAADNETWGYVEIRHKAHLFWWYYKSPHRVSSPVKPWPTILWLEGGPGGSGVGGGNFQGIGPLDVNLKPHNSTWLQKADLIFVDLPVGVGYSYVEDPSVLATTDVQVASDATELLKALTKEIPTLHSSPLFLVGESYGGKLAAKIGISVAKAIHAGALKLTLGGVVLGDSWISPDDFALSYAQLLHDVSRLSDEAVAPLNRMAAIVKEQIAAGQFTTAKMTWTNLVDLIDQQSDGVDMLNFLLDKGEGSSTSQVFPSTPNTIDGLMNGVIKEKLKVIPKNIIWQGVAIQVFEAMNATYMKPAIDEVDQLLAYGVNVSVYNGQFDVICSTIGVEAWVKKLKWAGLKSFLSTPRQALRYCDSPARCLNPVKAYARSYQNLNFYWILGAGHKVPVDKPDVALRMISSIVQSPDS
ncbi:serine carboxypeptidase-like 51 isoform X2 [Triticum aestivum]|uniref:Carboxypeptidase n=2 Tax=Triticum TaxID=4564 RepID=A0A9R0VTW5_TRITD|nr:serine carboxypeptidase-like 51 isoform X2 [Triticum aestivum]VAH87080.1 unnamed protein product [Triticum turgidum subsp. durum]